MGNARSSTPSRSTIPRTTSLVCGPTAAPVDRATPATQTISPPTTTRGTPVARFPRHPGVDQDVLELARPDPRRGGCGPRDGGTARASRRQRVGVEERLHRPGRRPSPRPHAGRAARASAASRSAAALPPGCDRDAEGPRRRRPRPGGARGGRPRAATRAGPGSATAPRRVPRASASTRSTCSAVTPRAVPCSSQRRTTRRRGPAARPRPPPAAQPPSRSAVARSAVRASQERVLVAQPRREAGERPDDRGVELGREQREDEAAHAVARMAQVGVAAIDRGGDIARGEKVAHVGTGRRRATGEAGGRVRGASPPGRRRPAPRSSRSSSVSAWSSAVCASAMRDAPTSRAIVTSARCRARRARTSSPVPGASARRRSTKGTPARVASAAATSRSTAASAPRSP